MRRFLAASVEEVRKCKGMYIDKTFVEGGQTRVYDTEIEARDALFSLVETSVLEKDAFVVIEFETDRLTSYYNDTARCIEGGINKEAVCEPLLPLTD